MPGLTVTRGLGGTPSSLIGLGFGGEVLRAIIKGGSRFVKKAIADLEQSFKITAMLLSVNGKELAKPIISKVARVFKEDEDYSLSVLPKKLTVRKADPINVSAVVKTNEVDDERN